MYLLLIFHIFSFKVKLKLSGGFNAQNLKRKFLGSCPNSHSRRFFKDELKTHLSKDDSVVLCLCMQEVMFNALKYEEMRDSRDSELELLSFISSA